MFKIVSESPEDIPQIETLLDQVFGPNRHDKASYAFRRTVTPLADLCLVARDGGAVVGTLRFWPVRIGTVPSLLLGPIGVAPNRQNNGIGRALIAHGHFIGQALGHKIVSLVGDGNYYCRFGYLPAASHGIYMANEAPDRLLVHELVAGSLKGVSGEILTGEGLQPVGKVAARPVA